MRAHTPNNTNGASAGNGRPAAGMNGSSQAHQRTTSGGISRTARSALGRSTSTQPSYNLFTGEAPAAGARQRPAQTTQQQHRQQAQQGIAASRPSSRHSAAPVPDTPTAGGGGGPPSSYRATSHESSKENMAPPDAEEYELQRRRIEELKAEVGTLRYKVNTFEQEKEMARLQHETEVRDARRKAEDDFKLRQAADAERAAAERKIESLHTELDTARSDQDTRQRDLERKVREAGEEARILQEQLDDLSAAKEEAARMNERRMTDLQSQVASAQRNMEELAQESAARETALQRAQQQLAERDETVGHLEADVLRLKAQTGDAATMEIIRRELKDQVNHIRALEATNREQLTELRHLRQSHKAVEIVEEEKRSLLRKLESAQMLEKELDEERMQRQRLETEHRSWASYLQSLSSDSDGNPEFDSPEAVAKALMEARYQTASLTEKIGALEPEVAERDANIRSLETQNKELAAEIEQLKAATPGTDGPVFDAKARTRLERQRTLAVKEVEYLRAQLKAFDNEDMTFNPEQFDQLKADRVQQLEELVDKYRGEAESLHKELSAMETPATAQVVGNKRPRLDESSAAAGQDSEQVDQLSRKARKLQDELAAARTAHRVLETELSVTKEQLASEKKASGVRVLSMRSNPTSDHENVKRSTLEALTKENQELLAHIQANSAKKSSALSSAAGNSGAFTTVPMSVLAAAQREVADAHAETASAQKTSRRLKEVWASKSAEFKEAVESTLGWHVTFIPNGKMRVESVYFPSQTDENENSIVFDGERGTMKVGGGPRSAFAQRIDDQIRFWVREKGCIPGFLAALTLEFCEEQARTTTVAMGR
ncbi:spindle assembly checkpoint component mad1 [Ophiostoma piceae UAMH 11346]|uniref:Spindle assembly checkpoint component MAD1 n=1 Tax=Ophiostoma piceae (strain UAMH 11346) TaxID=1262450 RepID=S3CZV6_OPHP1|nr:spindle assembly checkpoint component mad1 [Ophiostoma piceae UAMH 11346]